MPTHADLPRKTRSPFHREPKPRVPGRGRFTSLLIALGTIALLVLAGIGVVFIYDEAVEDAPTEVAETWYRSGPLVDLSD